MKMNNMEEYALLSSSILFWISPSPSYVPFFLNMFPRNLIDIFDTVNRSTVYLSSSLHLKLCFISYHFKACIVSISFQLQVGSFCCILFVLHNVLMSPAEATNWTGLVISTLFLPTDSFLIICSIAQGR